MKCVSLWQPWATLWMLGIKVHETRTWPTRHRGDVAVHASSKPAGDIPGMLDILRLDWDAWAPALKAAGCPVDEERRIIGLGGLPRGAVIGVVSIESCERCTLGNAPPRPERCFGDFTVGRYMWRAANPRQLQEPVKMRGMPGLFDIGDAIAGRVAWTKAVRA